MILLASKINKYICRNIAILMATYNGERYIREQIDSLLNQSYKDWTLFIHDDGSTDNTVEIISKYEKSYPNKIVVVDAPSTGGAKYNFMFLLSVVDAPYIMFCDQDDVWLEDKIKKTYDRMLSLDRDIPALVYTELKVVNNELKELSSSLSEFNHFSHSRNCINYLLLENIVTGCTIMINDKLAVLCRKYSDNSKIVMHDWWFALIAAKFGVISFVDDSLILYRQHSFNTIAAQRFGIKYFLKRIIHIKDVANSIRRSRKQAEYMSESFSLADSDIVSVYGSLDKKNKIKRLFFYIKNQVCFFSFIKNVALFIIG